MSALRISFKDLLWGAARDAGLNPDATVGNLTMDEADEAAWCGFLNDAMRWGWEMPATGWPDTVLGGTVTVTAGVIDWSGDLDYTEWYQVWSEDPRPYTSMAYPVTVTRDGAGLHVTENDLGEVYVLYRPRTPQYTVTAVDTTETYSLGQRVWNETADGEVYRAIANDALGDALDDADKWAVEPVYQFLAAAVTSKAKAKWLRSKEQYEGARECDAEAREELEREWVKIAGRGVPVQQSGGSGHGAWR